MEGFFMPGCQLPPGFRFHPTDQELIIHYLSKKVASTQTAVVSIIADIDLYKFNPWDLPDKAFFGEGEWFFFSPRDRKYPNGARPNRAAASGYWKATGTDKPILASGGSQCLGVKKALVFYKGRPPKGVKTDWVMHEYRLLDATLPGGALKRKGSMRLDDWVLCRVRQKSIMPLQLIGERHDERGSNFSIHPFPDLCMPKQVTREPNNFLEGIDYQLLTYLMGSQEEGDGISNNTCQNMSLGCHGNAKTPTGLDMGSHGCTEPQPPIAAASVQQMLESIKRTLSIGALDELMLLQPSKRLNSSSSSSMDGQSSNESVSGDQSFPLFMI